jgi:hypothetical protein
MLEHTESLRELLGGDLRMETVENWSEDAAHAAALLDFAILGTISWDKRLGRPDSQLMAEGFAIRHEYWYERLIATADGIFEDKGWQGAATPTTWDVAPSDDRHRVRFIADYVAPFPNRLKVEFGSVRHWRDSTPFAGVRHISPPGVTVTLGAQRFAVVEFEVVTTPYLELERAGVLTDR